MANFKIVFLCLIVAISNRGFAVDISELLPADQAFVPSVSTSNNNSIKVQFDIAEGYYLYRNKFKFTADPQEISLAVPEFPKGIQKHDDLFGDVEVYRRKLAIQLPFEAKPNQSNTELVLKYQGCADAGVCYPPQTKKLSLQFPRTNQRSTQADPLDRLLKQPGQNSFQANSSLLPADQAFRLLVTVVDPETIQLQWDIAAGYYLYREKIALELSKAQSTAMGKYSIPRGKPVHDEAFGDVEIFHHQLDLKVPLVRQALNEEAIQLKVGYQGCAEIGVCYPPMQQTVELNLGLPVQLNKPDTATKIDNDLAEQDQIANSLASDSLVFTLASFLGFGLLLAFTPCVFPMIPILSGIIVGQGDKITSSRAFILSLGFVLASALMYTLFGILAALFGSNLQATLQQPWVIITFSAIFVALALSMFGFYEIALPQSLQTKLNNISNQHRDGSLFSAVIMGALSALIVGPCVAAPLAGALIYIGQTGDIVLGGSALFMMGLGMGLPLLLIGASAGHFLPKAGSWLNATKAVFGVAMLAVAAWMLERVLPPSIIMFFWALLLIIPGVYMKAIDPLPSDSSGWSKLWKALGLSMVFYGLLILVGLSVGGHDPLKPLKNFGINRTAAVNPVVFERINNLDELAAKLAVATEQEKWTLFDFYADWCISCKEMEAYTFSDPSVIEKLKSMQLIQADVTKNLAQDKAMLKKFDLLGPPAILFFDPHGQERANLRVIGYKDAANFLKHLDRMKL
ncbi:MAG: protein-disulfide reductase DsbD [Methylococcaceae bacterium]